MDERWGTASTVLFNVAYTIAVAAMVLLLVPPLPPLRASAARWGAGQVHAWRYGRWLAGRRPPPRWTNLLARDDLPAEAP